MKRFKKIPPFNNKQLSGQKLPLKSQNLKGRIFIFEELEGKGKAVGKAGARNNRKLLNEFCLN